MKNKLLPFHPRHGLVLDTAQKLSYPTKSQRGWFSYAHDCKCSSPLPPRSMFLNPYSSAQLRADYVVGAQETFTAHQPGTCCCVKGLMCVSSLNLYSYYLPSQR